MRRPDDPVWVGGFVLVALLLAVAAVALIGGGQLFQRTTHAVLHFEESLHGLRIGAPVAYRGVDVGEVTEITAVYDVDMRAISVPVTIRIRPEALSYRGERPPTEGELRQMIDNGLRAQLQMQSLLTGQLFIALDFMPEQPGFLVPDGDAPSIPTVRSPWRGLQRSIEDLTLSGPELLDRATSIIGRIDELLASPGFQRLPTAVASLDRLLEQVADPDGAGARTVERLPELVAELTATAGAARGALARAEAVLAGLDERTDSLVGLARDRTEALPPLLEELERSAAALRRAADQWNALAAETRPGLREFSERGLPEITGLAEDATRMVNELQGAIRDLRQDPVRFLFTDPVSRGVRPQ
jgi:paraquat-inducible protein B